MIKKRWIFIFFIVGCSGMNVKKENLSLLSLKNKYPVCKSILDIKKYHGKVVFIEGMYEIDPVPGSKRLQACSVVLPDGERLIHLYRPNSEVVNFNGKKIIAIGRVFTDANQPPHVQQVMAPHIMELRMEVVSSIEKSVKLKKESLISSINGLKNNLNNWILLYGELNSLKLDKCDKVLATAFITLESGEQVSFKLVPLILWEGFLNKKITVLVKVSKIGLKGEVFINNIKSVCKGKKNKCGLKDKM